MSRGRWASPYESTWRCSFLLSNFSFLLRINTCYAQKAGCSFLSWRAFPLLVLSRPVLVATRDTYLKAASLDFICCVPDMIIDAGIIVKIIVIPPLLRMVFYFFFFTGLSGAVLCAAKFLPA